MQVCAPGIETGLVGLHYAALLGQIRSLHDSERFNRFKDEAKSAASKLDYDKENKRTMKNKLFRDETREGARVGDFRMDFRVNTHLVIADRLNSDIEKRKAVR